MSKKMEEYIKRQIELGYEPNLSGMDEADFDYVPSWASAHADRPQAPQLGKVFQPVDRGFAERIFKMFAPKGKPGWQMPNLDGPEYGQNVPNMPNEPTAIAMGYGPGGEELGVQKLSANAGDRNYGSNVAKFAKPSGNLVPILKDTATELISANEFGAEVEKEALARGDSPELAKSKGQDAAGLYWTYSTAVGGASVAAGSTWGQGVGAAVAVGGAYVGAEAVKPKIKGHVLSKTEADYNTLFPGMTLPGPG